MATLKREAAELACTPELEAKKTPASSGGAINTADTDCCKEDSRSPCQTSYERVYFGEHKRREDRHLWL